MVRPNILLLHCHDLGRFLGCYGHRTVHTPHLDALAADGVLFEQAFCTAPQCSPARASLFTGRYPHSAGVMGLTHRNFAWDLFPDERHLAQQLHENGYTTSLLGVQHESLASRTPEQMAARLGFDRAVPVVEGTGAPDRAEAVAAAACAELDRLVEVNQPFYLQVGFVEPHRLPVNHRDEPGYTGFIGDHIDPDDSLGVDVPAYIADEGESTRTELAELQGAVRYLDEAVGQVLAGLAQRNLTENTLVIFTTDHGLALPRAKCTVYDPGLEVAWIMRGPTLGWTGGARRTELVSHIDLLPTLLEVVGAEPSARVHGQSLRPLLDEADSRTPDRDAVYGEMTYHDYYDPRRCVRTRTHKLIVNFTAAPGFMDSSQSWRPRTTPRAPVRSFHPPVELYDLRVDPQEEQNLADDPEHAPVRDVLLEELHQWMRETADPLLDGAVTSPLHRMAVGALMSAGT
ncbi:sulfatase [Ruania alkalisoli]|uniref:Sulfatase n=1 Tax=Ruania alkalisoli TaxID=2779775 RepID=A0A7M1SSZ0_9MICO|nr:sulfatase [Ruania alkalisoli]QOR70670.1 sulfatase [Ruania alkalisoli]